MSNFELRIMTRETEDGKTASQLQFRELEEDSTGWWWSRWRIVPIVKEHPKLADERWLEPEKE